MVDAASVERRLKLHDLRVLMTIAEVGSMNKAAHAMRTSQSAISRTIADLEHTLGVRLLDRGPKGIVPTPYGWALIRRSVAVFDELRLGVKDLESLADPAAGEVRISAPIALAGGFVATVIDRLARRYPRVVCHLSTSVDEGTLALNKLEQRELDLVVKFVAAPPPDNLMESEILFYDPIFVVAATNNPWSRRRRVKLADLASEPWTLPSPDSQWGALSAEIFRELGLQLPRLTVLGTSGVFRIALVAKGRFLTIAAESVFRFAGRDMGIKPLPVEIPVKTRPVAIVTLKNRMLTPAAQLFIDCAREVAKPVAGLRR